jgi:hypothetical protein
MPECLGNHHRLPSLTIVIVPSWSVLSSGMPRRASNARISGCGCPNSLSRPKLATASFGLTIPSHLASVPFSTAVMGQLENRDVPDQVQGSSFPEGSLMSLAVAGEEYRVRPVLDPDSDRVVVLIGLELGRLGQDRQHDGTEFDLPARVPGEDRLHIAVTYELDQPQIIWSRVG